MRETLPHTVSLPEVSDYTDKVVFGHLGLPVGFDAEQILVNLGSIERIRVAAGLGVISVTSARGEAGSYDANLTSLDKDGTATFGAVFKRQKMPLANSSVSFASNWSLLGEADAAIELNSAEINERIREKRGTVGQYNAHVQAKMLNKSIKAGLASASFDANVDSLKLVMSGVGYGMFGILIGLEDGAYTVSDLATTLIAVPASYYVTILSLLAVAGKMDTQTFKDIRKTVSGGVALDRFAIASGLIKTSKLIKPAK